MQGRGGVGWILLLRWRSVLLLLLLLMLLLLWRQPLWRGLRILLVMLGGQGVDWGLEELLWLGLPVRRLLLAATLRCRRCLWSYRRRNRRRRQLDALEHVEPLLHAEYDDGELGVVDEKLHGLFSVF